jgi:hypothetical protein
LYVGLVRLFQAWIPKINDRMIRDLEASSMKLGCRNRIYPEKRKIRENKIVWLSVRVLAAQNLNSFFSLGDYALGNNQVFILQWMCGDVIEAVSQMLCTISHDLRSRR